MVPECLDDDPESDFEEEQRENRSRLSVAVQACPPSLAAFAHTSRPQKVISGVEVFRLQ